MIVTVQTRPHYFQAKPNFVTLPGKWGQDEDGRKVPITFIDPSGNEGDLTIPPSGLELDDRIERDRHNIDALQKLKRLKPYMDGYTLIITNGQEAAQAASSLREQKFQAYTALKPRLDDGVFCTSLARRLGYASVDKATPDEVRDWLEAFSETQPLKLMGVLRSQNQQLEFLITDALAAGHLRQSGGFYVWHGKPLGATEAEVLVSLHRFPEYVHGLAAELGRQANLALAETAQTPYGVGSTPVSTSVSPTGGSVGSAATAGAGTGDEGESDELDEKPPVKSAEEVRREKATALVQTAINKGVLVEQADEAGVSALYYEGNPMSLAGAVGSPAERAIALLLVKNNAGIVKELERACKP